MNDDNDVERSRRPARSWQRIRRGRVGRDSGGGRLCLPQQRPGRVRRLPGRSEQLHEKKMPLPPGTHTGGLQRPFHAVGRHPNKHTGKDAVQLSRGPRAPANQQGLDEHVRSMEGILSGRRHLDHCQPAPTDTQLESGLGGRDTVRPTMRNDGTYLGDCVHRTGPQQHPRSKPFPSTANSKMLTEANGQRPAPGGGHRIRVELGCAGIARRRHRPGSRKPVKGHERSLRCLDAALHTRRRSTQPLRLLVDRGDRGTPKS
jgi:hypothetical protein